MATVTGIALGRTEKVLWTGAPKQGLILRGQDVFLIPFSALWAGGVASMLPGMVRAPMNGVFQFFPLVFGVIALYITVGRFVIDIWTRARTTYAVTTDRVVIQSGLFAPTVNSINLRTLTDLTLSERTSGRGTITFGPANPWGWWGNGMRWPGMSQPPMFESIPDARAIYDLIRESQRSAAAAPA